MTRLGLVTTLMIVTLLLVVLLSLTLEISALSQHQQQHRFPTRSEVLRGSIGAALGVLLLGGVSPAAVLKDKDEQQRDTTKLQLDIDNNNGERLDLSTSSDVDTSYLLLQPKLDLSDAQLKEIITSDIIDRQFTATANMTRGIYDAARATFVDENITYSMDQWIRGTQTLFVGENSRVRLVGEVNVSPEQADFIFDEHLQFRIPFRPTVHLTGKVVLKRDLTSGYITSYEEFWDKDMMSILLTAKF